MRAAGAFVLAVALIVFSLPALAAKRVALVMGNSAYQNVNPLANPANDAEIMSATLRNAGFEVVDLKRDLKANEMRRALRDFSDQVRDADMAIVYFAGHGIEIDGVNYLLPVDAVLERDIDAFDEAVPLDRLLTVIEPARQLRLVILDACRDNPFGKSMKRATASRGIGRGLAKIEPSSPNTLIAFAAKAGSTALDGDNDHSPFTTALTKYLPRPGLDLRRAFGFARDDVLKATNNKQEPFIYGSLGGDDVALVAAPPPTTTADPNADIRRDYELAERVGTVPVWDSFINTHPSGFYTDLARAQRGRLVAEAARIAAVEKSQSVADEQRRLPENDASAAEQTGRAAKGKAVGDVAALTAGTANPGAVNPDADIPRQLQAELRRVGCNPGAVDGRWDAASQKSLGLFNNNARTQFDVKFASLDALEAVRGKTVRVCPLICDSGFEAKGDSCTRIVCKTGFELRGDGTCERIRPRTQDKPVANAAPSAERALSADRVMPSQGVLPGEPPAGTLPHGARVLVQSSACGKGQVLELIGGNNAHNIPRQKRCIAAN